MITTIKAVGMGLLASVLLLVGAGTASAEVWCARQFAYEQHELDRAIARHGFNSRQADHERRELARLREECRDRGYRFR
ncbi:MAG: hypothetical protein ABSG27_02930 [Candidatus Acidiferrales bacterium]|jgi:hypothetical protein